MFVHLYFSLASKLLKMYGSNHTYVKLYCIILKITPSFGQNSKLLYQKSASTVNSSIQKINFNLKKFSPSLYSRSNLCRMKLFFTFIKNGARFCTCISCMGHSPIKILLTYSKRGITDFWPDFLNLDQGGCPIKPHFIWHPSLIRLTLHDLYWSCFHIWSNR